MEHENVKPNIRIFLIGKRSLDFIPMLEASNVSYLRHVPKPGVVVASGEVLTIAIAAIQSFASVIFDWLASRKSRSINIVHNDNSVQVINVVISKDDLAELIRHASRVDVIDTSKDSDP